jgi:hypothetical protein
MTATAIENNAEVISRAESGEESSRRSVFERLAASFAYLVFLFVVAFPILFMDRVISPAEGLYAFEPWRNHATVEVQNPAAREAATAVLPMFAVHGTWDRFVAGGEGVRPAEAWSPWKLLTLVAPVQWQMTWIVLLQLSVAYFGALLWLRQEGFSELSAVCGAIVAGFSGIGAVLWILPDGYALALAPALLWLLARHIRGGSIIPVAIVVAAMVMSPSNSFIVPLTICFFYGLARYILKRRKIPLALMAVLLLAVSVALSVDAGSRGKIDLDQTGRLTVKHLAAFVFPERLGSASAWQGETRFGAANDFAHSTLYIGILPLLLLLAGSAFSSRRAMVVGGVLALLGVLILSTKAIPWFAAANLRLAIPLIAALLVASGAASLQRFARRSRPAAGVAAAVILVAAADLGFFAAGYLPYTRREMVSAQGEGVAQYLQTKLKPFRVAAFFDYLPPDTAALAGLEDIRSRRVHDPAWEATLVSMQADAVKKSRRVEFDSQRFDLSSVELARLNVRYLLEHKTIDLVRWRINKDSVPRGTEAGKRIIPADSTFRQFIEIDADNYWACELFVKLAPQAVPFSSVTLSVARPETGDEVWSRTFSSSELEKREKVYAPLKPYFVKGNLAEIRITPRGHDGMVLRSSLDADSAVYALTTLPVILDAELGDGRVFENLAALPRFYATWNLAGGVEPTAVRIASPDSDRSGVSRVPPHSRRAHIQLFQRGRDFVIRTRSSVPFFLSSSEKWQRGARFSIDGREAPAVRVNTLFSGTFVGPGRHDVVFRRASFVRWWGLLPAAALLCAAIVLDRRERQERFRATRMT